MRLIRCCYSSFMHYRAVILLHPSRISLKQNSFKHSSRLRSLVSPTSYVSLCQKASSLDNVLIVARRLSFIEYQRVFSRRADAPAAVKALKQNHLSAMGIESERILRSRKFQCFLCSSENAVVNKGRI